LLAGYEYNDHSYEVNYNNSSSPGGIKQAYKLMSYFARATYNYDDRFYATASLREDGGSAFVLGHPHVAYPAISLAYGFKKDLLANADWISDMKLRAGYGITGNSVDQNGNPLFGWEKREGRNIGLDFSLFNGRLSGDINYFNDHSKNVWLAYSVPVPPFVTPILMANLGQMVN